MRMPVAEAAVPHTDPCRPHPQLFPHRPGGGRTAGGHCLADLVVHQLGGRPGAAVHPAAYRPETYLPFDDPGTGLIIAFVTLTLLGFLTANLVGRTLVEFGEASSPHADMRPLYKP